MKDNTSSVRLAACSVTLMAAAVALPVHAQQFVVIDETYTATTANTSDSHYPVTPKAGIPADWTKPVDYSKGKAYVLLDILEKPSAVPTKYNICFENTDAACLPYAPDYTKTGRDDFNADFTSFWQYDVLKWENGVTKVSLILKDADGNKKQGDAMFYPTKVHVVITVVAPGGTYVPPGASGAAGSAAAGSGAGGSAGAPRGGSGGPKGSAGVGGAGGAGTGGKPADGGGAGKVAGGAAGSATSAAGKGAAATGGSVAAPTQPPAAGKPASAGAGATAATGGKSGSAATAPPAVVSAAGEGDEGNAASQLGDSSGCAIGRGGDTGAAAWFILSAVALLRRNRTRRKR